MSDKARECAEELDSALHKTFTQCGILDNATKESREAFIKAIMQIIHKHFPPAVPVEKIEKLCDERTKLPPMPAHATGSYRFGFDVGYALATEHFTDSLKALIAEQEQT